MQVCFVLHHLKEISGVSIDQINYVLVNQAMKLEKKIQVKNWNFLSIMNSL